MVRVIVAAKPEQRAVAIAVAVPVVAVVAAPIARPAPVIAGPVAIADDPVVKAAEPVAVAMDLDVALLAYRLLAAGAADGPDEAIAIAICPANFLDLLDLLRRRLALEATGPRLVAALDRDVSLDALGPFGALDVDSRGVVIRPLGALGALRPVVRRIIAAFGLFAMGSDTAVAAVGIGRRRHQHAGHQQGN